jgi:hypothetical protein
LAARFQLWPLAGGEQQDEHEAVEESAHDALEQQAACHARSAEFA